MDIFFISRYTVYIFVYVLKCGGSVACDRDLKSKREIRFREYLFILRSTECL